MDGHRTLPLDPHAALLQQLRALRSQDEQHGAESTQVREVWLQAVDELIARLRSYLAQPEAEGLARLDAATVHVTDDDVGAYDAPALKISLPGGRVVWVRPVGTLHVGARGIVDVVSGGSRALLVQNRAGVWKIRGPQPSASLEPLDRGTFAGALGELLL